MPRFDVQKFAALAGEEKLINLDISLAQVVKSRAVGSLVGYDDPWEIFCGNDLRLFIWPGPRVRTNLLDKSELAGAVRESLG